MSAKKLFNNASKYVRNWIEIDSKAVFSNCAAFRKLIGRNVKLWAVVKSNAYGHGLVVFSKLADDYVDGFCVDSVYEGIRLRAEGIKKDILVLGYTLPSFMPVASKSRITITISNFDSIKALMEAKNTPYFHLKIDTGMRRQGFFISDLPKVAKIIKTHKNKSKFFAGAYTHFASASSINSKYTNKQFNEFKKAADILRKFGFNELTLHCSATGGALIDKKYHLDAVRIGIGLYGLYPSKSLQKKSLMPNKLNPVLSWKSIVTEVKTLEKGDYVGYGLSYKSRGKMKMAVLPIGYWHGFSRGFSFGAGGALIHSRYAKTLGAVSMDMVSVDITGAKKCGVGDIAVLIGKDNLINAWDLAEKLGTIHYEILTRLNPLIERVIV